MRKLILGVIPLLLAFNSNASLISDNFIRTGASEHLVVPFSTEGGVQTVNTYSGFVEVSVSGIGNSYAEVINDAFYGVAPDWTYDCVVEGEVITNTCATTPSYQLGIGSINSPIDILGSSDAENFITFIDSVGFVTSGTLPAYDPLNHTYNFVVDTLLLNGDSNSFLTFGVTDDYFSDNHGEFLIDIYQVQAVPIPSALWLFGSGLIGLVGVARRKARS